MNELLEIVGLDVSFPSQQGTTYAVRDVSIDVKPGEVLGVVGESGAGKSTIGNAVINLLEPPGKITNGKVLFQGENISGLDDKEMRDIRGQKNRNDFSRSFDFSQPINDNWCAIT